MCVESRAPTRGIAVVTRCITLGYSPFLSRRSMPVQRYDPMLQSRARESRRPHTQERHKASARLRTERGGSRPEEASDYFRPDITNSAQPANASAIFQSAIPNTD